MRRIGDFNNGIFYSPDEGGADDATLEGDPAVVGDVGGDDGGTDGGDGGDVQKDEKPLSVREQLKKSFAEVNADNQQQQPATKKKAAQKAARAEGQQEAPVQQPQQAPATPAPESLSKEAKSEWDKVPATVQQAFVKREQDMQRGVDELKNRYALIDQAIAPHSDAIRQMNASPGEAVNRMFLWFKALSTNPVEAFPGLAKSFGYDWQKVVDAITGGQQPGQQQPFQQQQPQEIPEPVKNYIGQLEQRLQQALGQFDGRFNAIQQDVNAQQFAKTQENLTMWSQGKEFFEDVRQDMARFIESGLIPLKNGQVDLDTAYERAIHFNPEVRAKVLAKQQQANQEVQQASQQASTNARQVQVNKARRAAVSLPSSSAPGSGSGEDKTAQRKPGQRTPVRESLKAAIAQLRDQ